ncbi:MAG: pseudomurein-binding repeat-containing protein [Methanobacterium sp.]
MNSLLEFIGFGGGKINSRLLYTLLILFSLSLALPLFINTVSATTTTGNQTLHTNSTIINNTNTNSNTPNKNLASGSPNTTSTSKTTFTLNQINNASASINSFVNTNHRLPNYVTISNVDVTMPQFLQLVTQDLINTNSGSKASLTLKSVNIATNPSDNFKSGNILKSEYLSIANKILSFINSNGRAPNYATTSLGSISYESLIYDYSKIMNFYLTNKKLPNYVSVTPGAVQLTSTSTAIPASLQPYLQPGTYAQSTNPTIIALSASITKGLTTPYAKAVAIFDWVRDNITYSFYYGTKYGAVGTLSSGTANCVDHSDLVVALARAAGIPARYQEGDCDFSDGWYDHVWAQLYVNGVWYYADTISTLNTFGVINNWNLKTYVLEGTFIQFP